MKWSIEEPSEWDEEYFARFQRLFYGDECVALVFSPEGGDDTAGVDALLAALKVDMRSEEES